MNIIVDKPQLVRVVLLYLNTNFGNLTPKEYPQYPDLYFFTDPNDNVIMGYYKDGLLTISNSQLWSKLKSLFPINDNEVLSIIRHWVEETYNLKGTTIKRGEDYF
jgi:hypothetical protein